MGADGEAETGTLAQYAKSRKKSYFTIRSHSSRCKDFPEPIAKDVQSRGIIWLFSEIDTWYKERESTPRVMVNQTIDPRERALLGHKFRRLRQDNKCTNCQKRFPDLTWIRYEHRNGNELEILCSDCESKRGSEVSS